MQNSRGLLLVFCCFLQAFASSASAAVLRKKSGRAIIMGFSKTELQTFSTGQHILIENFEKNQWTGLIKKIYRVNRVRITLIEDDSEEMEVGEIFRIKPGEAPLSPARPEFDPSEYPGIPEESSGPDEPMPLAEAKASPTPTMVERAPEPPPIQDRLLLGAGLVTRYYIVPAGRAEGDLHGTGTQIQGTYLLSSGFGISLGLRKESLVYTGVDQFSDYNASIISYFAGLSYSLHLSRFSFTLGLRKTLQAKGAGALDDVLVGADQQPLSVLIRGVGEMQETAALLTISYDWEYISLFAEGSLSLASELNTKYRWQLQSNDAQGGTVIQEYRTSSSFKMQVQGLTLGLSVTL